MLLSTIFQPFRGDCLIGGGNRIICYKTDITFSIFNVYLELEEIWMDRRGHDRRVVGFTTTCATS
jgi:hypothetical protein